MSRLTTRGFTQAEADEFMARCSQPHTVRWSADVYRWTGGSNELMMAGVPIVGGTLTLDSSNPTRRTLSIDVGGGFNLSPRNATDPLVPFGQVVYLYVQIDGYDGTFGKRLKMGEFPIISYSFETPSEVATVEAADYSVVVNEYLHLSKKGYGNMTLKAAVVDMVNKALPGKVFSVVASASDRKVNNYVAEAGSGRWDAATELCQKKAHECFFDSQGNIVIRPDITDDNDEAIPGVGPDIGTVSSPIATIRDGEGGNLIAMTATVTREGGCNGVVINIHETADQKKKRQRGDARKNVQVTQLQQTGPAAWGDVFGRIPIVSERNVKTITDAIVADARGDAARLLHRRRGVIRYLDIDALGLLWVEPDDKIRVQWGARQENHYCQSISFDLAGREPARIRTRQLAVVDPGA